MPIVAGGLGLPEQGAIAAGGYGQTEPAAPGAMSATLTGSGTCTATLTATGATPAFAGRRRKGPRHVKVLPISAAPAPIIRVAMTAQLAGTGECSATLTALDFNLTDLELLFVLDLV